MKKTLIKDTLRSLKKNKLRFISVVLIIAMGIGFYVGIKSAAPRMRYAANEYYNSTKLMDIRVASEIAFTEEDINKIKELEGVGGIIKSQYVDANILAGDMSLVDKKGMKLSCRISTFPVDAAVQYSLGEGDVPESYINRLTLEKGRFPEKPGECVVDARAENIFDDIKIGSVLTLDADSESITDSLSADSLTVVGTVSSPMYISADRGKTKIGSGSMSAFVYVDESTFKTKEINELFILIDSVFNYDRFSEEYENEVTRLAEEIKALSAGIIDSKLTELKREYSGKIKVKEAEIKAYEISSAKKLSAKKKEIDEFKAYVDSEDEILAKKKTDSEKNKSSLKSTLDSLSKELSRVNASYEANQKKLNAQSSEIKGYTELKNLYDDLKEKHEKDKKALDSYESRMLDKKADLENKTANVTKTENSISDCSSNISSLSSKIAGLNSDISNLEREKGKKERSAEAKKEELQKINNRITEIENGAHSDTPTEMYELIKKRDSLDGEIRALQSSISVINSSVAEKKNIIGEAERDKTSYQNRLKELQVSLAGSKSEQAVAKSEYDNAKKNYDTAKKNYDSDKGTLDKYVSSMNELTRGESNLSELMGIVEREGRQVSSLKNQVTSAQIKYTLAVRNSDRDIKNAQYELNKAKNNYYTVDEEYSKLIKETDGRKDDLSGDLRKLRKTLKNLDSIRWGTTPQTELAGHGNYASTVENLDAMSSVFPHIFLFTAMIACIVIMLKNITDERKSIGLFKALGYSGRSILNKYMLYSFLAWAGGCVFGVLFGVLLFPKFIYAIFSSVYNIPSIGIASNAKFIIYGCLISLLTTYFATFIASVRETRHSPAVLLRPKSASYNRRSLFEKIPWLWNRMNYGMILVTRTVIRCRKRVIVGVLAIACCSALIFSSYGLLGAAGQVTGSQYGRNGIFRYDFQIVLNSDENPENSDTLHTVASDERTKGAVLIAKTSASASLRADGENAVESVNIVVPSSKDNLGIFVNLQAVEGDASLKKDGVIISEKLAELLGVHVNETVYFTDADDVSYPVKVNGIVKNYLDHYAYFLPEAYEETFAEVPVYEYMLSVVKDYIREGNMEKYSADLVKNESISGVTNLKTLEKNANISAEQVWYLVVLFVFSACVLAFVIMYTISNVSVSERTHEIANIKVIGFNNSEVLLYVTRENIVASILGTAIGIGGGALLYRTLVGFVTVDTVMYSSHASWWCYIATLLTAAVIYALAELPIYLKVNKIKMAETLKSVD